VAPPVFPSSNGQDYSVLTSQCRFESGRESPDLGASSSPSRSESQDRDHPATAEMENILNHQYYVALTPLPSTGEPRLWRLGLRWEQH